jgi:hypothetical protein
MPDTFFKAIVRRYSDAQGNHPSWPDPFSGIIKEGEAKSPGLPNALLVHLGEVPTYEADGAKKIVIAYVTARARLTVWHDTMEEAETLMEEMLTLIEGDPPLAVKSDANVQLFRENYLVSVVPGGNRGVEGEYVYQVMATWRAMFNPS